VTLSSSTLLNLGYSSLGKARKKGGKRREGERGGVGSTQQVSSSLPLSYTFSSDSIWEEAKRGRKWGGKIKKKKREEEENYRFIFSPDGKKR